MDGKYVATLTVNDGTTDSDPDTVEIEAEVDPNEPPEADASEDQAVVIGETVQLYGSGSSDLEGDPLSYSWTLNAPGGSSATLSDGAVANPSFVADVGGKYLVTLVVNDGTNDSAPDSVEIEAEAS